MKENVGHIDRLARAVVGPTLVVLGYTRFGGRYGRAPGLILMMSGLSLIGTAISGVCPLNALFRLDTRSRTERALTRERDLRALRAYERAQDAEAAFGAGPVTTDEPTARTIRSRAGIY
jgi:hypothetical protein